VPTFSELTQEVLSHQFSPAQYTTYIQGRLNQGQAYVAAQTDFRELESIAYSATAEGDAIYDLPDDFQRIRAVYLMDTDNNFNLSDLTALPLARYELLDKTAVGTPSIYTVRSNFLQVWPWPSANLGNLALYYYAKPATLVNAGDTPQIPSAYHNLLVSYALWHCYERENDYNSAMYHKGRFDEDIMKCRGEVQYDTDDYTQPKQIGDNRRDPMWTL
jgi:hypothetical protein